MVRFQGFIGGTYSLQSVSADCQRCVNLVPQVNEQRTAENGEIGALFRTPGKTLLGTIGTGPIRGTYTATNGNFYVVSGNGLYQVDTTWSGTLLGTLSSSVGRVQFQDNGVQMVITDGNGYVWDFASLAPVAGVVPPQFQSLANTSGWLGSNCAAYLDQWGIFAEPGTNAFYTSNQLDFATYDGLNVAYKQGHNDPIVSIISDKGNVWLMGRETSEIWYNAQNAPPGIVLSRIPGSLIEIGCCSPHSPQQIMNTIIWLGDGKHGAGVVWQAQGYAPNRISTHAIEVALQSYGYTNLQNATAYTYQQDGHGFYVLNVPTAPVSWVYDVVTGQWHERMHLVNGLETRDQGDCHAWWNQQHVVGDYQNGNLYALDKASFMANGQPMRWMRRSPKLVEDMAWMFHDSFQADMEVGTGLDGTGQGIQPQVMLRYSNDMGHTWSCELWRTSGAIGQYRQRPIWRNLGRSRSRIYELSGTDPVSVTLLGAELGITPGTP